MSYSMALCIKYDIEVYIGPLDLGLCLLKSLDANVNTTDI